MFLLGHLLLSQSQQEAIIALVGLSRSLVCRTLWRREFVPSLFGEGLITAS